jgi:tetratricopeptide (TPR) repeat protein
MNDVVLGIRRAAIGMTFVLASAFTMGAAPRAAHAQQQRQHGVDEGRTRFNRGIELYKEGNFHAALAEFRAAYASAPSYRIHYNLGQTLYQLQDYAGAVRAFDQYLAEGGDKIEAERKKEVESDLAKLRPRVAKLRFVVNVPAAEISVDDEPRGQVQKQALLVSEGRRRVSVTASGYQTETRVLDVAGAQQLELTFELKPIGGAVTVADDDRRKTTESPPEHQKSRTPFYVGLVTTGALGAGTIVMAVVTASNHSRYEKALDVPNDPSGIDDARTATRTTALVADVLAGATLLSAGLTVVAFALTSGTEPATTSATSKAIPPKALWRPVVGPASVGVVGAF